MAGKRILKDPLYEVWLSFCLGAGSSVYEDLFSRFSSAYEIYRADGDELAEAGVPERIAVKLMNKDLDPAWKCTEFCRKEKIGITVRGCAGYPERLGDIPNPPFLLYYKGRMPDMDSKICTAMVGTRSMSEYGMKMAYKIGYELGAAGAVVVSGMALGVDAVAACGAIESEGITLAVAGCGLDRVYPASHGRLMSSIIEHGAVISEYPPGSLPSAAHFPMRNRIISGVCQGTLIVEAGERSGALITAREAIRQGRAIYALPGNIGAKNAAGTNSLIRDGARIVLNARDILVDYQLLYGDTIDKYALARAETESDLRRGILEKYGVSGVFDVNIPANVSNTPQPSKKKTAPKKIKSDCQDDQPIRQENAKKTTDHTEPSQTMPPPPEGKMRQVYDMMKEGQRVTADDLEGLGYPVGDIVGALSMLEITGHVVSVPGGGYLKKV